MPRARARIRSARRSRGHFSMMLAISTGPTTPPALRIVVVGDDGSAGAQAALRLAERLRDPAGELIVRRDVEGRDGRALVELAEREAADLLVLGPGRHAEPGRIRPGRTLHRVLREAPCPVALAPLELEDTSAFRHLGVAHDGSPPAERALELAFVLAGAQHAALTIYHAVPPHADVAVEPERVVPGASAHERGWKLLTEAAERAPAGVNPEIRVVEGFAADAVATAADRVIDLLLLGARGHGALHRAVLGSVSAELLLRATFPVIVVPSRAVGRAPGRPAP